MNALYMTAYSGAIAGPIARFFGLIINGLYDFFETTLGIDNVNIGFMIVIFTILVNVVMLPLTYNQQKFSNLQRAIQPELHAIQKKYKNKRDQVSMMKQNEETQALYDKYGISMTGSCLQLLIQLPILYALFGVFQNLPAYITSVRNIFTDMVTNIQSVPGYREIMQGIYEEMNNRRLRLDFLADGLTDTELGNYIIDVVYKLPESGWASLKETFSQFSGVIGTAQESLGQINYLFALNISDTPSNIIMEAWRARSFGVIVLALMVPLFAYLSQALNLKLANGNRNSTSGDSNPMAQQMETMNKIMPIISLVFVVSMPVGLGIYWIVGALVRSLFQFIFNKRFESMDLDSLIEKNRDKAEIKRKKREKRNEGIAQAAQVNARKASSSRNVGNSEQAREKLDAANAARSNAKPGSLSSKANMVAEFNQRNNKK